MENRDLFPELFKQHNKLAIRIISPSFGHLPKEALEQHGLTHRKSYYFFLFLLEGETQHVVDLQEFNLVKNELLFILPNQIHQLPGTRHGTRYYKLGFDEDCLALLPRQFAFLVNPFNNPKIHFPAPVAARLQSIFALLLDLLRLPDSDPQLIIAHLNSLLTEVNAVYFSNDKAPAGDRLSRYIQFKLFIEDHLTDHTPVADIAGKLGLNANSLYSIVKHYSGLSPKEFINKRLVLEAKRRLCYAESASIKELAYDLGFNDPEYFARLFKKETGKSISNFIQDLSGT